MLLGSGGREHALACDPNVELVVALGNPGTTQLGRNVNLPILDGSALAQFAAQKNIDLVVIGPEAPLVAGVADVIRAEGIPVFGPSRAAALLEGSKAFAKDVMAAAGVPTAQTVATSDSAEAEAALDRFGAPYVVKDDGLAAGKGVVVTEQRPLALAHVRRCLSKEGGRVVVEEYLDGPEVSLFCICDGTRALPLAPAQDFKRTYDGDEGPNTGGMGAYSPLPWAPADICEEVVRTVATPVLREMAARGTPFVGLLYCGLALTSRGLRVVEFNVRFGDPETQVVLPRLRTPLADVLLRAAQEDLEGVELDWSEDAVVTVLLASPGYPESSHSGDPLTGVEEASRLEGVHVIHAGTAFVDGRLCSDGGRVACLVGQGSSIEEARSRVYEAMKLVSMAGGHDRTDIAAHLPQ